jgi:hypothetical protein
MTERRFRQLYEQVQAASRVVGVDPVAVAFADRLYGEARDAIIGQCNSRQAALMDWAMENGYPEFETVLRYGAK